mmetsp:Transcript_35083/g.99491  ORF Transcript_35083/g.99491 Transcript_35083/m.99491 type:complete len:159 (-) Transcript_35083:342-818(-)
MTAGIASFSGAWNSLGAALSRRPRSSVAVASQAGLSKASAAEPSSSEAAAGSAYGYEATPCFALDGVDFYETMTLERHAVLLPATETTAASFCPASPCPSPPPYSANAPFLDWLLPRTTGSKAYAVSPSWSFDGLDLDLVSVHASADNHSNLATATTN